MESTYQTATSSRTTTITYTHLSSASVVTDASGTLLSENRYTPFGEVRDLPASMSTNDPITETDFGFTGQRNLGDVGLMDYNARFYSPALGRFIQPDTLVPNPSNPQALNRYSYAYNNPCNATDPSGHMPIEPPSEGYNKKSICGKMVKGGNPYYLEDVGRIGLKNAKRVVEKGEIYRGMDSTSVAGGIVVQSNVYNDITDKHGLLNQIYAKIFSKKEEDMGYGYAQMGVRELSYFGFSPGANDRKDLAPLLMGARLQRVISVAENRFGKENLSPLDYFLFLAFGQNNAFMGKNGDPAYEILASTEGHTLKGNKDIGPRWDLFIPTVGGSELAKIREYDTELLYSGITIIEYGYAFIELSKEGWELPYDINLKTINQGINIACGRADYHP